MKKTIIIAITIIVLATIVGMVVVLTKENTVKIPLEQKNSSEQVLRSGFLEGCLEDGTATYSQCDCMFEELYNKYGEERFIKMSLEYSESEELPESFISTVLKCY